MYRIVQIPSCNIYGAVFLKLNEFSVVFFIEDGKSFENILERRAVTREG